MTETNVRTTDIREWIFEAVAKIGAPAQYIQKESGEDNVPILKLEDYQVATIGFTSQNATPRIGKIAV